MPPGGRRTGDALLAIPTRWVAGGPAALAAAALAAAALAHAAGLGVDSSRCERDYYNHGA